MKLRNKGTGQRNVWQIAAGDRDRGYEDCFLKYKVGLLGRGPEEPPLRSFKECVEEGDIFLLREGAAKVSAVGEVVGGYRCLEQFDDVNGWYLPDARRVKWYKLARPRNFSDQPFGTRPRRFSRVKNQEVVRWSQAVLENRIAGLELRLPRLPSVQRRLAREPRSLSKVIKLAGDIWREREKLAYHPKEDELVAHLIVPLLRSLQWPPQQIAVKWQNIDVAVFRRPGRDPEACRFVIEAKRLGRGIESALGQAKAYVRDNELKNADIILTDGVRYRLYLRRTGFEESGYANLANLKQKAARLFSQLKRR